MLLIIIGNTNCSQSIIRRSSTYTSRVLHDRYLTLHVQVQIPSIMIQYSHTLFSLLDTVEEEEVLLSLLCS